MKSIVQTQMAPKAIGPYSQGVIASGNRWVFLSGQIPLDPATGELVGGDIRKQTGRVLENLAAVLQAAGASLENVVKTTVYLKNLEDFPAMNEIYGTFFRGNPPARATVEVSRLPRNVDVEMDAVALLD